MKFTDTCMADEAREQRERAQMLLLDENKSPCNCVPDGDDGSLAHLCEWHKSEIGDILKTKRIASTVTVKNFLKLSDEQKLVIFAHGLSESTARKKAEERAESLEKANAALVAENESLRKLLGGAQVFLKRAFIHSAKDCAACELIEQIDSAMKGGGE